MVSVLGVIVVNIENSMKMTRDVFIISVRTHVTCSRLTYPHVAHDVLSHRSYTCLSMAQVYPFPSRTLPRTLPHTLPELPQVLQNRYY